MKQITGRPMIDYSARRAINQFGLGANRRDLAAAEADPLDWVRDQLEPRDSLVLPEVTAASKAIAAYQEYRRERGRLRRKAEADEAAIDLMTAHRAGYQRLRRDELMQNLAMRFDHAVTTESPVRERFALFWSNHFSVSRVGKPQIASACCGFENEAIRPAIDGYFADMLVRSTSHPVMLMYLDNVSSVGPKSKLGRRRDAGLNENLAREVLELHTLGVDGGYDQADVTSLARILTGWTVGMPQFERFGATPGEFVFAEPLHEPGTQSLLGKAYRNDGVEQGIAALKDLATQPAAAKHVATRLVRHFVADEPASADVERVAAVFRETSGHLPSVHEAVLTLPGAWDSANRKFKTPYELLISAQRALDAPSRRGLRDALALGSLRTLNHFPFSAPSPEGWPDTMDHWAAPNALKQRIEWGVALGRFAGNRVDARELADAVLARDHDHLAVALDRAESPAQALSMLFSSPEFQWRS